MDGLITSPTIDVINEEREKINWTSRSQSETWFAAKLCAAIIELEKENKNLTEIIQKKSAPNG